MANSLRVAEFDMNIVARVSNSKAIVKIIHQSGTLHQFGNFSNVKFWIILTKMRQGKAISRARGDRKPRTLPGIIRFPII